MNFRFSLGRTNKAKTKNSRAAQKPVRRRPTFELLEDRVVPTLTFMTQPPVGTATGLLMAQIQVKSDAPASVPVTLSLSRSDDQRHADPGRDGHPEHGRQHLHRDVQ